MPYVLYPGGNDEKCGARDKNEHAGGAMRKVET